MPQAKDDNVAMRVQVHLKRPISDRELWRIGEDNPGWKVERVDGGIMMAPTTIKGGIHNAYLTGFLVTWGRAHEYLALDSNAGVTMPNTKRDVLVPDGALLSREKWDALTEKERDSYARVDMDVVVEIVSKTDSFMEVVAKCERWHRDGAGYVVLLDPRRGATQAWGTPPRDFPAHEQLLAEISVV